MNSVIKDETRRGKSTFFGADAHPSVCRSVSFLNEPSFWPVLDANMQRREDLLSRFVPNCPEPSRFVLICLELSRFFEPEFFAKSVRAESRVKNQAWYKKVGDAGR